MPTNLASPSICTSCLSVDPSLHDAGSIGPGNCPGSTVEERGDPCYWTVYHDPDATGLPRSGPPDMSYCRGPKSGYKMLPPSRLPEFEPRIIAPVTPSPPFRCPHAVHPCPSVDSG